MHSSAADTPASTPQRPAPGQPVAFAANLAAVALGGAVGSTLRYALNAALAHSPDRFPLPTFIENILGSFLLGLLTLLLLHHLPHIRLVHLMLCTGVLGSFTTFSNLTLETAQLAQHDAHALALLYPLLSIALGLAAALLGMATARAILPRDPGQEQRP